MRQSDTLIGTLVSSHCNKLSKMCELRTFAHKVLEEKADSGLHWYSSVVSESQREEIIEGSTKESFREAMDQTNVPINAAIRYIDSNDNAILVLITFSAERATKLDLKKHRSLESTLLQSIPLESSLFCLLVEGRGNDRRMMSTYPVDVKLEGPFDLDHLQTELGKYSSNTRMHRVDLKVCNGEEIRRIPITLSKFSTISDIRELVFKRFGIGGDKSKYELCRKSQDGSFSSFESNDDVQTFVGQVSSRHLEEGSTHVEQIVLCARQCKPVSFRPLANVFEASCDNLAASVQAESTDSEQLPHLRTDTSWLNISEMRCEEIEPTIGLDHEDAAIPASFAPFVSCTSPSTNEWSEEELFDEKTEQPFLCKLGSQASNVCDENSLGLSTDPQVLSEQTLPIEALDGVREYLHELTEQTGYDGCTEFQGDNSILFSVESPHLQCKHSAVAVTVNAGVGSCSSETNQSIPLVDELAEGPPATKPEECKEASLCSVSNESRDVEPVFGGAREEILDYQHQVDKKQFTPVKEQGLTTQTVSSCSAIELEQAQSLSGEIKHICGSDEDLCNQRMPSKSPDSKGSDLEPDRGVVCHGVDAVDNKVQKKSGASMFNRQIAQWSCAVVIGLIAVCMTIDTNGLAWGSEDAPNILVVSTDPSVLDAVKPKLKPDVIALGPLDCSQQGCLGTRTAMTDRKTLRVAAAKKSRIQIAIVERATFARFGDRNPITGYQRRHSGLRFLLEPEFWHVQPRSRTDEMSESVMLVDGSCHEWSRLVNLRTDENATQLAMDCHANGRVGRRELFVRFVLDKICRKSVFSQQAQYADAGPIEILADVLHDISQGISENERHERNGPAMVHGDVDRIPNIVCEIKWFTCVELTSAAAAANEAREREERQKSAIAAQQKEADALQKAEEERARAQEARSRAEALQAELEAERAKILAEKASIMKEEQDVAAAIDRLRTDLRRSASDSIGEEGLLCPTAIMKAPNAKFRFNKFHFMVFGGVGAGKSTTLHWLCHHAGLEDSRCRGFQFSHGSDGADHTHTRTLRGLDMHGVRVFDTAGFESRLDQYAFGVKLLAAGYQRENYEIEYQTRPKAGDLMGMRVTARVDLPNGLLRRPATATAAHALLLVLKFEQYSREELLRIRSFLRDLHRDEVATWRDSGESAKAGGVAGNAYNYLPGWIAGRNQWLLNATRSVTRGCSWCPECTDRFEFDPCTLYVF
mmetsp:Transcript_41493/g.111078  ORF Transcript_41493/g.111078 Transcript_41493/m.111078 type:complete len:1213 (-) Transcript_41493:694-4332(-)